MKFWDSSGIVPLVVNEPETDYCLETLTYDQQMMIWCLSKIEIISALCRQLREKRLSDTEFRKAKTRMKHLLEHAYEIHAIQKVRQRALRLLEVHPLRAADACQLGSALIACQEDPERLSMVCFDERLTKAALKEGFSVNPGRNENEKDRHEH